MIAQDLVPLIAGVYGFILAVFLALVGGGWWLRGRFSRTDARLERIGQSASAQLDLLTLLIRQLARKRIIAGDELMEMVQMYLRHHMEAVGRVIGEEERTHNPLDKGELARVKYLISKVQAAEVFTQNEVEEYNALVAKLKEGRDKTDPGVAALVTVGDLLVALKPSA